MGAHNSTPQTVRVENPQHDLAIQVNKGHEQKKKCDQCQENQKYDMYKAAEEKSHNRSESQEGFNEKYSQLEEHQFEKTVERMKAMFGEPLALVVDVNEKLTRLRVELINCYNNHPKESLFCYDKAKQYQDFIYYEQYKGIQRFCGLTPPSSTPTETE